MGYTVTDIAFRRTWGPKPNYPNVLAYAGSFRAKPLIVAGPCSVESQAQIAVIVPELARFGIDYARGGVFRAGTYPHPGKPFGLEEELADFWVHRCRVAGLKVVMEVLDLRQADWMAERASALQVGCRGMQSYPLLREVASFGKLVFLKRSVGAKVDEWLGAAEHLLVGGCKEIILVERGISTFNDHCRWTQDISAIPAVKAITGIPVVVDASHGTGRRDLVLPMTLAGIAAGADGYLVEVHPEPEKSLSDADQALPLDQFPEFQRRVNAVWGART